MSLWKIMLFSHIFSSLMPSNSFATIIVYDSDILKAIYNLHGNGSPGCDKILPKLFKNIACHMMNPIRIIFSSFFNTGVVPLECRIGIVCSIYKNNGKPNESSLHRPLFLSSVICEIFENVLHSQLTDHLMSKNLILR